MNSNAEINRQQILLISRPDGLPRLENFKMARQALPDLMPGQFLLKTEYLGLAPAARIRMGESKGYAPPTKLGSVVYGQAAGTIVESLHPGYRPGEKVVVSDGGWQDYVISDGSMATKVDEAKAPLTVWLGALGVSGLTAYVGLLHHGAPKPGETLLVSAASGAVGSVVGQIGKIWGCRVVGVAGGEAKCAHVTGALRFDACVDHRAGDLGATLRAACPNGIDIYFDNVGGAVRDEALAQMNPFGRVVLCGMISEYNGKAPQPGPNWLPILTQRLSVRGFLLRDSMQHKPAIIDDLARWYGEGRIVVQEDVTDGLVNAPEAFIGMLEGRNFGKALVRVE